MSETAAGARSPSELVSMIALRIQKSIDTILVSMIKVARSF